MGIDNNETDKIVPERFEMVQEDIISNRMHDKCMFIFVESNGKIKVAYLMI